MASKVFVGNLAFKTSRDEVQSLFAQAGKIKDVFLPTDRESGRPRGFAFVEFESDEDAQRAIEKFNGYELGGRPLRVNAAEDRPRGAGGGAGRPGGGYRPSGPPPSFEPRNDFDDRGFGSDRGGGGGKNKGSRRNLRAKKRSL
ncbi:MAG TPA: RNA-binding protein [Thermoanaerobaculia bacterium]